MSTIDYSVTDGVARIVFANEAKGNVMGGDVMEALAEAGAAVCADVSIKVILLAARGANFGVGGDINEFVAHSHHMRKHVLGMASRLHSAVTHLRNAPAPVVAAVKGVTAGASFSVMLGADMVIASRSAKIVAAYTRSGLTPDGGGTYFLPRIVGRQRAFDLLATNPTLTADEAQALGIVARVADDAVFEEEVEKLVQSLAEAAPGVLPALKKLLQNSASASLESQLAAEAESISTMAATPTTLERLKAFLARKKS